MDAIDSETLEQRLARLPERFWEKVQKAANDGGCWEWVAGRNWKGYGTFTMFGRKERAHRLVLMCKLGRPILLGFEAMHSCDRPSCVNPEHLSEGTRQENMADRNRKGRQARGETNGEAILTEDQVRKIRGASGAQRQIAARLEISQMQVSRIRSRKNWAHVA